jgi:exonuclease SbcC
MKLKSLKGKGIGGCKNEWSLPVDQLTDTDRVIAITGRNGAGKTTLCECLPALPYGDLPSYGSLAAMANDSNSFVDGVIETDQAYRLLRTINAARKQPKTEAYIFDAEGKPLNDGKQTTFAEAIKKYFPSQNVYLASGFSSQNRDKQFLDSSKVERKSLFADLIGCGRLQQFSEAAGKRATAIEKELSETRAKVEILEGTAKSRGDHAKGLKTNEATLTAAKVERKKAEQEVTEARKKLDTWNKKKASLDLDVNTSEGALREAKQQHEHASDELDRLRNELAKVTTNITVLQSKTSQREELKKVAADNVDEQLTKTEKEIAKIREAIDFYHDAERRWRAERDAAEKHLRECKDAYKTAVDEANNDLKLARQWYESTKKTASGLDAVPCNGQGSYSTCLLLDTATEAAKALKEHGDLTQVELAVETAKANTADGVKAKAALEAVGEAPEAPDSTGIKDLEIESRRLRACQAEIAEAKTKLEALVDTEKQIGRLEMEAKSIRNQIDGGPEHLDAMAKDVASIEGKLFAIRDRRDAHEATKPQAVDEATLVDMRRRETQATADVATAKEALATAERAAEQVGKLRAETRLKVAEFDDWKHLQKALGRDGIQALEVDAAGPEVSDLVNELLHSCFGTRFTGRLETTAPKADGNGTKEIFDLIVIDSEKGRECSASAISGGERVIIAEALSLAIAIFNTRQSSIPILDLWRDETAGQLDFENAPRYPVMLRKALEIGKFNRIFFIAHQRELHALADRVIEVVDGQARLAEAA